MLVAKNLRPLLYGCRLCLRHPAAGQQLIRRYLIATSWRPAIPPRQRCLGYHTPKAALASSAPSSKNTDDTPMWLKTLFHCEGQPGPLRYPDPIYLSRLIRMCFALNHKSGEKTLLAVVSKYFSTDVKRRPAIRNATRLSKRLVTSGFKKTTFKKLAAIYLSCPSTATEPCDDITSYISSADYCIVLFRVVQAMQAIVANGTAAEIDILENELVAKSVSQHASNALPFFYWLTLLRLERVHASVTVFEKWSHGIVDILDKEMLQRSAEAAIYKKHKNENVYHDIPLAFSWPERALLLSLFGKHRVYYKDKVFMTKFLTFNSLKVWNIGQYSTALKGLHQNCETFIKMQSDQDSHSLEDGLDSVGAAVSLTLNIILRECTQKFETTGNKKTPDYNSALQSILTVSKMLAVLRPKNYFLPYFLYGQLKQSDRPDLQAHANKILADYPKLQALQDVEVPPFIDSMDLEWGYTLYRSYRDILAQHDHLINRPVEASEPVSDESPDHAAVNVEPDLELDESVVQEMLDIKVLEALRAQNTESAFALIRTQMKTNNIAPSMEVCMEILKSIVKTPPEERAYLLNQYKQALPVKSDVLRRVCQYEVVLLLKECNTLWTSEDSNQHMLAINNALDGYMKCLREEDLVEYESLDNNLNRIEKYLRLFCEESFIRKIHMEVLKKLRAFGEQLESRYDVHSISALYWEMLFFSGIFDLEKEADKYLRSHTTLAGHIDADRVVVRALRVQNCELLTTLMELSLQTNMDKYQKSIIFEGLVKHYCRIGSASQANKVFETAQSLNISIGPEATAELMLLQKDIKDKKPKQGGIRSWIFDWFRPKGK